MVLAFSAAAFLTIVLLVMGLYYLYDTSVYGDPTVAARRMRVDMDSGLRAAAVDIVRRDAMREEAWYSTLLSKLAPVKRVQKLLKQANSPMPVSVFMMLSAVFGFLGLGLALATRMGPAPVLGITAFGASLPYLYHRRARRIRLQKIEEQLPEALDLIGRTLLAGHAFIMGLKLAAEQVDDPIRSEFNRCFEEISFGISVADSMKELADRVDSVDVRFFVTSVIIQLETGGNLAEIVQNIAALIRARFQLYGKIQVLSSEGRFSAMIMFALPIVVGAAMTMLNPEYMGLLFFTPGGQSALMGASVSMVLGMIVTRRMIQIKV